MAKTIAQLAAQLILDNSKFDKGIDDSKKKVERFAKQGEKGFSRISKAGATLIAQAGAVELGFKGVTAVTQLMNGDLDDFVQTMESLPAGIGPAVAAFNDMAFAILGVNEQIERTRQLDSELLKHNKNIQAANSLQEKLVKSTEKYNEQLMRISATDPFKLARRDAIKQAQADLEKLTSEFEKLNTLGKTRSSGALSEAIQERGKLLEKQLKIIEDDRLKSKQAIEARINDQLSSFFNVKAVDPVFDKIMETIEEVKKLDEKRSMLPPGFKTEEARRGSFQEISLSRLASAGMPKDKVLVETKKQTDLLKQIDKNTRIAIQSRYSN